MNSTRRFLVCLAICCTVLLPLRGASATSNKDASSSALDRGYHDAYNLDFNSAQQEFAGWEHDHPSDPVAPVSEAAGILFAELDRLGVLETQFYQKDSVFLNRPKLSPDAAKRAQFDAALERARSKAQLVLAKNPKDNDALFTMALVNGLQADYAALVENRNMASL